MKLNQLSFLPRRFFWGLAFLISEATPSRFLLHPKTSHTPHPPLPISGTIEKVEAIKEASTLPLMVGCRDSFVSVEGLALLFHRSALPAPSVSSSVLPLETCSGFLRENNPYSIPHGPSFLCSFQSLDC